jgi:hypothetical protein
VSCIVMQPLIPAPQSGLETLLQARASNKWRLRDAERSSDLSFRNRLLNHSDAGRRILKVRRLSLAELYAVVVDEGKTLTISAAPVEMPVPMTAPVEALLCRRRQLRRLFGPTGMDEGVSVVAE